eukprot:scaffold1219_cov400-Prasinococcus_capsulatus_cf.AAC.10
MPSWRRRAETSIANSMGLQVMVSHGPEAMSGAILKLDPKRGPTSALSRCSTVNAGPRDSYKSSKYTPRLLFRAPIRRISESKRLPPPTSSGRSSASAPPIPAAAGDGEAGSERIAVCSQGRRPISSDRGQGVGRLQRRSHFQRTVQSFYAVAASVLLGVARAVTWAAKGPSSLLRAEAACIGLGG